MENIKDLRDEVLDIMARLKDGRTSATKAKEMANLAGKAINSAKIQIEYEKNCRDKFTNKRTEKECIA